MKKSLKTAFIISWSLTLLFSILILLNRHLFPSLGFSVEVNHTGESMLPTLNSTALSITDLDFPFEELKVGDIISFRRRRLFAVVSQTSNSTKKGEAVTEEELTEEAAGKVDVVEDQKAEEPKEEREIQYISKITEHRIVEETVENGEKAFITRGDNNDGPDLYPVVKSGFIGKNVFFVNGLGLLFKIVYVGLLLVSAVTGVLVIKNLIAEVRKEEAEKKMIAEKEERTA
ncbi:MAG: hypothetical protein IJ088_07875 [Clostridia bacterium]|nr:hypothetical protein [Clostridia bacterium]